MLKPMQKLAVYALSSALLFSPITLAEAATDVSATINFAGTSSTLSAAQKTTLTKTAKTGRVASELTCLGNVAKTASVTAKSLATKRAKAVCDYTSKLLPNGIKPKVATQVSGKSGQVSVKLAFSQGPTNPVSLQNLDPIWTEELAWQKVREYLNQQPTQGLPADIRFTSNVTSANKTRAKNQLDTAYRFWSKQFSPQASQIEALFWHDKDITAAQNTYNTMLRGGVSLAQLSDGIILGSKPYCAHAAALRINSQPEVYVFHQCVGSGSTSLAENHTTIHEYTHFIHFNISSSIPIWITEGSATFYGEALGIYDVDYGRRVLDSHRNALFQSYDLGLGKSKSANTLKLILRKNDAAEVKNLFRRLESPMAANSADYTSAYLLGSFATGVLVANYGHEKFVEFMMLFKTSSDYGANFQTAFGITPDQFYELLTPYLAKNPSVLY